ncbi:MAG: response regulator, partial [bacterium]|nr:response regulator [bacterium]
LGGQAQVTDVGGVWKDLTENVNFMAANLTSQVRNIAEVTTAVANGDLSRKISVEGRGEILELKNTINEMVEQLSSFSSEVTRVAGEVGTEGKLGGQAQVRGVSGTWRDLTDNVNLMAANLTGQVRNIADVTTAVANGDLSKKVTVDVRGEILELKNTINQMVDQLNSFAGEVTRVAREVGTEGKLGGQAQVSGVSGTWRDLTDNVNQMADNLTEQVRGIARVVTAVANGDLKRKLSVEAKGEVAALGETLNEMTETLATFADQVITVAREVGVEGRLGGQASVPGAAGTWKDLTDNVNQLAATLTNQIRAIADVSTAVTEGDLTRSIGVEAFGEVAVVKDKINEMIRALRETNQRNQDQDWLKTNLARFTGLLQGQRDLQAVSRLILSELAPQVGAQHGVFYTLDNSDPDEPSLRFQAGYAYRERKNLATVIRVGEGLVGQCALEKERILLTNVPHDYVTISSGLGEAAPLNMVVLPILFEGQVRAVIELASFERFSPVHLDYLDQLTESIGIVLNTIEANMRTEGLLKQSQSLAGELQHQQEELRQTNEELEQKAAQLAQQNDEVERKNREVEQARASLEEKAEQLDITSRYKSEFLANMSHELRTPLNSMLILSEQLAENQDGTLTPRQIEFANIINSSGRDLLELINDVLDLTKIEAGQISVEMGEVRFRDLQERVELAFRHVAESKGLGFVVEGAPELPRRLRTDAQRLEQILKNLLSNAFKFTREGQVELRMRVATSGWGPGGHVLDQAPTVVAFDVIDSGVGIPREKQRIIFEAFQQADGTTSRSYGGTGLGLSISRELVRLLGGQITLQSEEGSGSRFTVYLPLDAPPAGAAAASPSGQGAAERSQPELRVVDDRDRLRVVDDRDRLRPGEPVLLIVEDDANFSRILLDLAHRKGFTVVVARDGNEVLDLAKRYRPSAITLDLGLRDISGWKVLEGLRSDPDTKDIPVHVVSVFEDASERVQAQGATSFVSKPTSADHLDQLFARIARIARSGVGTMLVVEPDASRAQEVVEAAGRAGIRAQHAESGQRALDSLRREPPGCVLLNLTLGDMSGLEFLRRMRRNPRLRELPVVVTGQEDLSRRDRSSLVMVQSVILQDAAGTPEQLVANVERVLGTRNGDQQSWLTAEDGAEDEAGEVKAASGAAKLAPGTEEVVDAGEAAAGGSLAGRHILVVDDDIRNLYALKSLLESSGASVDTAESGAEAMTVLQRAPGTELMLLDIMMPGKDGFQVLREIRAIPAFQALPVIAVTAKAMKGDREELLEAGATDYVAKPVRSAKLLETVRAALRGAANPE